MKKLAAFFVLYSACYFTSSAQSLQDIMTQNHPACKDVFINAADELPKLYHQKAFDSMHAAIDIWLQYCSKRAEIFYTQTLLSIQESKFSTADLPDNGFAYLLNTCAEKIDEGKNYQEILPGYEYKFYKFIQLWAKRLLEGKTLDTSEVFLCNVFAGNIPNPERELKGNRDKYPELYALLTKDYYRQRNGAIDDFSLISGVWLPTGNLKILGAHPSFGIQLGVKNKRNQFDLTLQFRFVNSQPGYYVLRSNSLYLLHYYFGGYIGADYTHYFIHKTSYEFGLLGGIGYDGFDISSTGNNDPSGGVNLDPSSINSFNFNGGLRFNYYFNPGLYLGILGRYNVINYNNTGGSSLQGNAFSIDLILGGGNPSRSH